LTKGSSHEKKTLFCVDFFQWGGSPLPSYGFFEALFQRWPVCLFITQKKKKIAIIFIGKTTSRIYGFGYDSPQFGKSL